MQAINFLKKSKTTKLLLVVFSVLLLNFKNKLLSSTELESFQKQLTEYKANAPWVMQELLNLPLKDFFKGFEDTIYKMAQSHTRTEYFDEKKNIEISDLYARSLWQCVVYEIFLKNIYLKSNDKQLDIFQITKKIASTNGLTPILEIAEQLDIPQGVHHPMFVFYAFYCDCLVNQFSELIKLAYAHIDEPSAYKSYCQLAVKFNKQIKDKVSKLKNWSNSTYDKTKYEAIYADLYEKNQQIINLLKKQSKQSSHDI